MKEKVIEMMNKVYIAMGGKSQTTLSVIGMAVVGHINNMYWDEAFIPEYCEFAILDFWSDVDDRDFLSSEMMALEDRVRDLLKKCKEEASIRP
jgi:hypothetical protein